MRCTATHDRVRPDGSVFDQVTCERDEHAVGMHAGWSYDLGDYFTWPAEQAVSHSGTDTPVPA